MNIYRFCQDSAVNISDLWKSAKAPILVKTTLMIWVYFFTSLKWIIPILRTKTFVRFPLRFWTWSQPWMLRNIFPISNPIQRTANCIQTVRKARQENYLPWNLFMTIISRKTWSGQIRLVRWMYQRLRTRILSGWIRMKLHSFWMRLNPVRNYPGVSWHLMRKQRFGMWQFWRCFWEQVFEFRSV